VTTPPLLNESVRRLGVEGISPAAGERALAAMERLLGDGPLAGPELRALLEEDGHPVTGPAFSHLCFRAGVLGLVVRGPMAGGQHAYVLTRDWLGARGGAVDRDVALAELARRYLAGHAPASDRDLARWAGVPLRDARAGLGAVAAESEEREDGLVQLRGQTLGKELPPPRLLGAFDPVLLGWTSREEITGRHTELITVNGLFRPFAMVGGKAVATWRLVKGKVEMKPLEPIAKRDRVALDADAADVERFMQAD
jgi:hypothetical protein